jgi:hypothetical protein
MPWEGPYKLRALLDRVGGLDPTIIPENPGVYVFSLDPWQHAPANLVYLGSSHNLFRRTCDSIPSALGFCSDTIGDSQGGWLVSGYCRRKGENPLDLYFGWLILPAGTCPVPCEQKLHARHYKKLSPLLLNSARVNSCGLASCSKRPWADIANGSLHCMYCYSF